jgi:hypothetical protein
MSTPSWLISRRTALRGIGVAMALPLLEAMTPPTLYGAEPKVVPRKMPVRFGVMFFPNGVNMEKWKMKEEGALGELSPTLLPMEKVKSEVLVLSELWNEKCNQGDGHYFKDASFLTSMTINKTTGADLSAGGTSIDQLLAQHLGQGNKLPSIELGIESPARGVDGNVNITRLYSNHIAWSSATTPLACELDPKQAFDRLFRAGKPAKEDGAKERPPTALTEFDDKSVLDAVMADGATLKGRLGVADQRKLDEYLTSVRDVERRLSQELKRQKEPKRADPLALKALPALEAQTRDWRKEIKGANHTPQVRIMLDIMLLAFWTDTTRVGTFMFGNSVSGRNFSFLDGVKDGHHECSHHENKAEKLEQYAKISAWHVEQFAYLVERMKQIKEGPGTLLDNSMILFGSALSDGNSHNPRNLPLLLAGKGGNTIKTGRHIKFKQNTALSNLYGEIAIRMGLQLDKFADSNGPLKELAG